MSGIIDYFVDGSNGDVAVCLISRVVIIYTLYLEPTTRLTNKKDYKCCEAYIIGMVILEISTDDATSHP